MLGANLGSLLYGDVSVMSCHSSFFKATTANWVHSFNLMPASEPLPPTVKHIDKAIPIMPDIAGPMIVFREPNVRPHSFTTPSRTSVSKYQRLRRNVSNCHETS